MKIAHPTTLLLAAALAYGMPAYAQQAPASPKSAQPSPQAAVSFVALNVSDMDKSVAYYKLVGFSVSMQVGAKPKRSAVLNVGTDSVGGGLILVEHEGAIEQGAALSRVGIRTPDAAALCKRLAEASTPCMREPRVVPQDRNSVIGFAKDPDGNSLEIIQLP